MSHLEPSDDRQKVTFTKPKADRTLIISDSSPYQSSPKGKVVVTPKDQILRNKIVTASMQSAINC